MNLLSIAQPRGFDAAQTTLLRWKGYNIVLGYCFPQTANSGEQMRPKQDLKAEWSIKVESWRASGQSAAAWCKKRGETYHVFLYWRQKLRKRD
jgi:hypothetical protein